jgi:hypothetical protein
MKKSLILMCIGGMLALCTPLAAGEAMIDPPIVKHAIVKKDHNSVVKAETPDPTDDVSKANTSTGKDADARDIGGYVVISAGALLLILILIILLL